MTGEHIAEWMADIKGTDTTRAIMLRSVFAVLGWAAKARLIPENPARHVPRPKCRVRAGESVVAAGDVARLLAVATPQFGVVVRVLHATGCRPGEVAKITAENLDAANGVAVLADHKTDRTGRPRFV
ncbi:MAG TPA: hypothetical protein VM533_08430 [Fimbriiglobus sp.]|nr:hypothetical protein [Fimbriiglobus sp.]